MSLLNKSDLQFPYSWTVYGDDAPAVTGKPDNVLLNRNEGYEVLAFINKIAEDAKISNKELGLKLERMIHNHLPEHVMKRVDIRQWLINREHLYA